MHPALEKPYIIGIDPGIVRMGMCVLNTETPKEHSTPHTEISSLLQCKDGRVYKEYEEGIVLELLRNWIRERWVWFEKAKMVGIEKQMTNNFNSSEQRACLMVQMTMAAFLDVSFSMGIGPLYVVFHPDEWKDAMGIERGKNTIAPIPHRFVNGVYIQGNFNPNYKVHKLESIAAFERLLASGDREAIFINNKYSAHVPTDVMEAYFIASTTRLHLERNIKDSLQTTHHNPALTSGGRVKGLKQEMRMVPLRPYWEPGIPVETPDLVFKGLPDEGSKTTAKKRKTLEKPLEKKKSAIGVPKMFSGAKKRKNVFTV